MADPFTRGVTDNASTDNPHPANDRLAELRSLLLEPEQTQLIKLQKQLENLKLSLDDARRVLPKTIIFQLIQDKKLITALTPAIEESIKVSVNRDRQILADAIFPMIGPAIRKATSTTFGGMIQSLDRTLEDSLSWRGLKWRLEAARTGKSFAEVVLSHTLIYRVEQVFLIHKETGLLLQHVIAESVEAQDADLVSAMLTAIQDFVHDSFGMQKGSTFETLQFGELTVWIEHGPQAILAGVIRGNPPPDLRAVFQNAIENIHLQQSDALESFRGDAAPFRDSRPHLEDCLQTRYIFKDKKISLFLWMLLGVIIIALIALGLWIFYSVQNSRNWADYIEKLNAEPGIVVIDTEKRREKYFVSGLRDPMAADPLKIVEKTKINPEKVTQRWEPFLSFHPEFALARAKGLLLPPEGVSLRVEKGILYATGSATHKWIVEARRMASAVPGITEFRESDLVDTDIRELDSQKERVEEYVFRFKRRRADFLSGQKDAIEGLVGEIQKLYDSALAADKDAHIEIVGHASSEGDEEFNVTLSQTRADRILSILTAEGFKKSGFNTVGVGTMKPLREELTEQDKEFNRSVSFRVGLNDEADKRVPGR